MFTYKGEYVQFVQSFKYLGIDVPLKNKWSVWFESRLQASWKSYYMLQNKCNKSDTHGWDFTLHGLGVGRNYLS